MRFGCEVYVKRRDKPSCRWYLCVVYYIAFQATSPTFFFYNQSSCHVILESPGAADAWTEGLYRGTESGGDSDRHTDAEGRAGL